MTHRTPFWLTVAALFGALAVVGSDVAEAKKRRPRGRKARAFLSAPAPEKGRTPDLAENGAPAGASRDVAGAAFDGEGRKDVLGGGAAILLSGDRALVANPYRGLAVVDVSDPESPAVLGTVDLEGSADRVFVDGTTALVVSRDWSAGAGRTLVTAVDLSDATDPAITGTAVVEGELREVAASGPDLVLVTTTYGWGPCPMVGDPATGWVDGGRDGTVAMPGKMGAAAPDVKEDVLGPGFVPWWGGEANSYVSRVTLASAGDLQVVGTFAVPGTLLAAAVEGDTVALAIDRTVWWTWDVAVLGADPPAGPQGLQILDVDASGSPTPRGQLALDGLAGVSALDVEGDVARLVGWTGNGLPRLATFGLGSGDPDALGSAELPTWPGASAFTTDRFAFTFSTGFDSEPGVVGRPDDVRDGTTGDGPVAWVQAVDLSDPSAPALGNAARLGDGWTQSLHAVDGDVVAALSDWTNWDSASVSTDLVRVGLDDPTDPSVGTPEPISGSWYATHLLGDLLLLSGGAWSESNGWVAQVLPVSLAAGGVEAGAPVDAPSWVAAAAFEAPILALASIDTLRLVDLSDLSSPEALGSVRLAANVADLAILGEDAAACLVTDFVGGSIEVRTVALPAADPLAPLDVAEVGTGDARLFRDGSMLYVLATDWQTGGGRVTVVDAGDPSDLRVRGSLDLASYPGQAFLVNGSLVLLREAWSLVDVDEETGRATPKDDPFGRAPRTWLRDEQRAVLDVIDLADPDAPRPAARKRILWDTGGEAILRGTTLYVPSFSWAGEDGEGVGEVLYGVYAADLSDPVRPRVSRLVDVPGSLVGAADADGRVLTVSYGYDPDAGTFDATLNLVDLTRRDWRQRVLASRPTGSTAGAVVVGADHAYVSTETWDPSASSVLFHLRTFALADLAPTSTLGADRTSWSGTIAGGHLFLRSWGWTGAIDAYDLADPAAPVPSASAAVDGVGTTVGVARGRAWVPAGYRGIASFDLSE